MALLPELLRFRQSIDTHLLPPFLFSAKIMERAMMDHAERQGPFIAHLTAERARLGETQMMRVAGRAGPTIALVLGDIFRGKSSHRLPAGTRGRLVRFRPNAGASIRTCLVYYPTPDEFESAKVMPMR
jgi:hypothetical protein